MKTFFRTLLPILFLSPSLPAQNTASTFVDENGVMRWTKSREEVTQFGVNYTVPFAYAFRAHKALGVPWEKAIDADVYHFARLGLDAYRVHVWDREISDPEGNLIVNEHVQAFDYLLAKLKERGIKIILTPLQFGDAGYPASGEPLKGFSSKYGKKGCLEDKTSWPLQERYLAQFVNHVNPRTGLSYKDDPDVLAFEICNEPGHHDYALALEYINRMTKAIRDTGCGKPVFYNMSHGLPVSQAYLDANVQGGTFQWYPSNLVANHEQRGNFLPYLDDYPIPFAADPKFRSKAKMFYEFDTADIGRSYLYPAMARTFRKVGAQFATQFAYDPMYLAAYNTEYRTHYLNLAYAPQKALSLKIAGEAFHRVPRFKDYGDYPNNTKFAGVRVSYEDDLSELVTAEKYFHSNHTSTPPPEPQSLQHIAGYGNSPIISYPGQGAYFLDRLESGVWRLEVMPDAIWVRDPFERASTKKTVSYIAWNEWPMNIKLPDLGENFHVVGLNDGNAYQGDATGSVLSIRPGAYLLTRQGLQSKWTRDDRWENIVLKEFVAPAPSLDRTYVLHKPLVEVTAGHSLRVTAIVASPHPLKKVELVAYLPKYTSELGRGEIVDTQAQPGRGNGPGQGVPDRGGARSFVMTPSTGFEYSAEIPADEMQVGAFSYHIVVQDSSGTTTFPSETKAAPTDWDFYGEGWKAMIVAPSAPVLVFDAAVDSRKVTAQARDWIYDLAPSDRPGNRAMQVLPRALTPAIPDHSFRFFFRDKLTGRTSDLAAATKIVLYGKSVNDKPCLLQLALITSDGIAYGGLIKVSPEDGAYAIPLKSLQQVRAPNIPHGYPVFIPFWSSSKASVPLDLNRAESVLVSIGPGLSAVELGEPPGVQIERIWLE
jgi:hypothetical protein